MAGRLRNHSSPIAPLCETYIVWRKASTTPHFGPAERDRPPIHNKSGRRSHTCDDEIWVDFISCSLTFRSPDATVIRLVFGVIASDEDEDEGDLPADIRERLRIYHSFLSAGSPEGTHVANRLERLFKTVGLAVSRHALGYPSNV